MTWLDQCLHFFFLHTVSATQITELSKVTTEFSTNQLNLIESRGPSDLSFEDNLTDSNDHGHDINCSDFNK